MIPVDQSLQKFLPRNHFSWGPESFLKVNVIDAIGLSPYLGSTSSEKMMVKNQHVWAKLQFPPPSADSLSTTVGQQNSLKNATDWILRYDVLSCFKNKKDFRLPRHPHIALPKRKTRSYPTCCRSTCWPANRVEEFMSNSGPCTQDVGKPCEALAFSPKIRHIHRRVCCSFEFEKVEQEFEEEASYQK